MCAAQYHLNEHIIMPLTKQFKCSFVELVAEQAQRPTWCDDFHVLVTMHQMSDVATYTHKVCVTCMGHSLLNYCAAAELSWQETTTAA